MRNKHGGKKNTPETGILQDLLIVLLTGIRSFPDKVINRFTNLEQQLC